MSLTIFNYLTRKKEEFKPIHSGFVGMYVCGPTVYGDSHIGHGKCYITFDVINRWLRAKGYKVRYVQNITDVGHLVADGDEGEDKIQKKARLAQLEPMEVVEGFMRSYFEDMDKLNILRPDISPRATGHVPEQIEMANTLIKKGVAYESNGSVFFSVKKWKNYGKLSGRKVDELEESGRLESNPDKHFPADFAVWRAAKPDSIMKWNSPWGPGIPGWHAECTVMSAKYLGLPFDIHGGGLENIFPHNESEIAQAEAAYGKDFSAFWVLNNMVTVDGTKMGKSLGNFTPLKDAYKKWDPIALRFFILESHYRSNTDFSEEAIQAATKGYQRLLGYVQRVRYHLKNVPANQAGNPEIADKIENYLNDAQQKFNAAMDDDFSTPQAIAVLFDLGRSLEPLLQNSADLSMAILNKINEFYQKNGGDVLGIISDTITEESNVNIIDDLMQLLIDIRNQSRKEKNWAIADQIRNKLNEAGVVLEDHPNGTHWKINS